MTSLPDKEVLIGLAVSGGGSRAALFAAGALEALGRLQIGPEHQSVLDQVSHISSVSGGSLASAYYVLKKPSTRHAHSHSFRRDDRCRINNFSMSLNARWLTTTRVRSFGAKYLVFAGSIRPGPPNPLAEILNEEYLGKTKFLEVAQWEQEGHSPSLLINTTLYNDGRRLVLSTLDRERFTVQLH